MKQIIIRGLRHDDLETLKDMHAQNCDFPLPDLDDKLYFQRVVAEVDGKIIAIGLNRVTSEAILILDKKCPRTLRTRAIVDLISSMQSGARAVDIDESHAFVEDDGLINLLKHLGYTKTKVPPMFMEF